MKSVAKAWVFLALASITLVVLGEIYGGREGLLFALILALGMNSFVYFYEDRRVLSFFGGKELEGQDSYGIRDSVRRLALKARVPMPRIVLLPSAAPQSGVVGRNLTHGTILLTQGCLDRFSRQELEAVLAYQIANIRTLNTLAFAVSSFIASLALAITETLDAGLRILIVEKKRPDTLVSRLFTTMASPFVGFILRISLRPSLYSSADQLAAQLIGDPKVLAQVIWKLEAYSQTLPFRSPASAAHLFMVSPLNLRKWERFFIAQPKPHRRIQAILGYYPV